MRNIKFYLSCSFFTIASLNLSGATDEIIKTVVIGAPVSLSSVSSHTSLSALSQESGKKRKREEDEELKTTESGKKRKREEDEELKTTESGPSVYSEKQTISFQLKSNPKDKEILDRVYSSPLPAKSLNFYTDPSVEEMYIPSDVRQKIIDFYFDRSLDLNVDIKAIPNFIDLCFNGENQAIYQYAFISQRLIEETEESHKQLITHIHNQAKEGSAEALYNLGVMYELGVGVKQDQQEALKFYEKAAHKNHAGACKTLGSAYQMGCFGMEQDEEKALEWLNIAAIYGNPLAQFELGLMYHTGCGAPRDSARAALWYTQAANAGLAMAQVQLGDIYEKGELLPQSYEKAKELYFKAASQGDAQAQFRLAEIYHCGNSSTQANVPEAERWYRQAGEQGYVQAQLILGVIYEQIYGDEKEAIKWYKMAAAAGNSKAQYALVGIY